MRLILIVVAISGVTFYVLFVRPTVVANKFVSAIERNDYSWVENSVWDLNFTHVDAKVLPREWSDIWRFQRRIALELRCFGDTYGKPRSWWTERWDVIAGIIDVQLWSTTDEDPFGDI
jgi:hypothetical protein